MTRNEIERRVREIFREQFEIEALDATDDLREVHGFDSIDAIELLREIEILLDIELSQEEKKAAMGIRTLNDICDWVAGLAAA
jgi:acyl carrier protein